MFLHGLLGSAANWRRITPSFEKDFEILVFDQRGHGRSFQPESGYAPEDYAGDLFQVLEELGWEKISLVGHSMGGRNALHFAYQYPDRIEKLVIEDIGPDGNRGSSLKIEKMLKSVPVPFSKKSDARDYFNNSFEDISLGQYLYSNIVQKSEDEYSWRFSLNGVLESLEKGRARERWEELRALKMETLVVRGENSQDLSRETFEEMLRSNTNIQGETIVGAGHWVHFDKPDEFIDLLTKFLI